MSVVWSVAVTANPYRAPNQSMTKTTIYIQTRIDVKSPHLEACVRSIIDQGYRGRIAIVAYDQTGMSPTSLYENLINEASKHTTVYFKVFNKYPDVAGFVMDSFTHFNNLYEVKDVAAIFMNDDVVFENNPQKLLDEFEKDRKLGVAAAASTDEGAGILFTCYRDGVNRFTPHVDNHCWAIKADVLNRIGFPDRTGHWKSWYSNIDFCYRIRKSGYLVKAIGLCKVRHFGGAVKNPDPHAEKFGLEWLYRKYKTSDKVKEVMGEQ